MDDHEVKIDENGKPVLEKKPEEVRVRKKSGVEKVMGNIIQEDVRNVKDYFLNDLLFPTVKRFIVDTIKNGIEMLIYGNSSPRTSQGGRRSSTFTYRSYGSMYDDDRRYDHSRRSRSVDYDEKIFDDYYEAKEKLTELEAALVRYNHILSVFDYEDITGLQTHSTHMKYGWTDISEARIMPYRDADGDGWIIRMPKAMPLD